MAYSTFTRVYDLDGSTAYVTYDEWFSPATLDEFQTYASGLSVNDLAPLEIAEFLDNDAENGNYHHLANVHRWILLTLTEITKYDWIHKEFMIKLLDKGGVHNF